ncbi:MAG: hypothetical protein IJY19_07680 [Ruminococcus sp.]|nr:hypothetical protein [Ruminococcus sp.]
MSDFGSADGIIEIILEIDDKTGKIYDTAVKTKDGKLFDLSVLKDPEWWNEQGIKVGKTGIKYTLKSMNGKLNYGNVSNFIWTIVNKVDRKIKKAIQIGQEPKGY